MMSSGNGSEVALQVVSELPADWDTLLDGVTAADFFHTSTWTLAACGSYPDLQPLWITARQDGALLGGLVAVRRLSRLPLLGSATYLESHLEGTSGGPLVRDDLDPARQDRIFQDLVEAFFGEQSGLLSGCSMSLNTRQEERFGRLLAADPRWQRREVPGAVVDLTGGLEQVEMTRLTNNKRNERNRALKRGARFFITSDSAVLDDYYPIYLAASQQWGTPPVPLAFLKALLSSGPQHAYFTCVALDDQVLGGHLCLVHGDRVMAWNGVTAPELARTHFPGTLSFWGDIVEACRRGARQLDFGASGGVHSLSGFKKHFGAELESRGFYTYRSVALTRLQNARQAWQRIRGGAGGRGASRRWHDGRTGNPGNTDKPVGSDSEERS